MAKHDLVRPSRDGDQFHYHWAARQCLALLPGAGDLVAVTIEGPSVIEVDGSLEAGDELIDVGLYFGSEALEDAQCVRYIQLKHSTRHALEAWTASGLEKTIRGFSQRYASFLKRFPAEELKRKVKFEFTTNRPIEPKLREALDDLANAVAPRHPELRRALVAYTKIDEAHATDFFQLFSANGGEPSLWAQRNLLYQDINTYLPEADYDSPVQLKELVTRKATTEFETDPAIRKYDVLRALKVSESELLPSPCEIVALKEVLPREQESEILDALLTSEHPIVIHAEGGVGKSMLALRLAASMPSGSESVLYDCFGDGLYRNALHFRHRHRDALVQISNQLAARGLCHPLIPSSHGDAKQYMRAFCGRLSQAIGLLRARDPNANLCLLIDAADNADMAAEEQREVSFVRDLIRAPLPNGIRLAFTCRTHRRHRLAAPPEVREIELRPFSEAETACHLRGNYPNASNEEVAEFAFLSSSNPRVQALALERRLSIQEMLKELGPAPSTIDRAIGELLHRAVSKLKDRAIGTESCQIDLICQALAVLRPLVPIAILAQISGTSESAVRSFALDLGRPLLVKGSSVHFLDEPSETWFREKFKPDSEGLKRFLDRLRPLAAGSSYVSSILPQLLLAAGKMDELIGMALSDEGLPTSNPLERRDVELQRLIFALKACLHQGRHLAAAKLALKAGGEAAGESRQIKLIQENTDIAAVLLSPDRIDELVSRRTFGSSWMGSHHAYDAGLLSGRSEFSAEAASRLRMAIDWLYAWARRPQDDDIQESVDDADRAELAMALLRLRGPQAAARFLRGWTSRHLAFTSGKRLARRLIDLGQYEQLDAIAHAASNDIWLLLGLAAEVAGVGRCLPLAPLSRLMRLLAARRVKLPESTEWNANWDVLYAVQAAVMLAVRAFPERGADWGAALRRYLPDKPPSAMAELYGFDRAPMLRAYALEAALRGHQLTLCDVAPVDVRDELEEKRTHGRSRETEIFEHEVGGLLPWFILGAEVACGRTPPDLSDRIDAAAKATANAESRDYQRRHNLRQTASLEWIQILRDASAANATNIDSLCTWTGNRDKPLWTTTLMSMCRIAARAEGLASLSLEFAASAYEFLEEARDDAESRADSYQNLARAILPVSAAEAAAYFNRAVEISSRIGDENLDRWSAFLNLAKAAAQRNHPRPQTAYRLSRVAELTYEYVARDKYFDWNGTVEALTDLCGSSALAILGRWRDRRFGREGRLLPVVIYRLMEQDLLPTSTPIALSGLDAEWNRLDDLKCFINAEGQPFQRRLAAQIAYRYIRVQDHDAKTWAELAHVGNNLGIELPDVERLRVFSQATASVAEKQPPATSSHQAFLERKDPDWRQFFLGIDMADSTALRKAYVDLRTYDPPYQLEAFFQEGLKHAGIGKAPEFVGAVATWPDFGTFELRSLLDALPESALKMLSLRKAIRDAVMAVCRREPERVRRRGWGAYLPFQRLDSEGIAPDRDVVQATLEGYAVHADTLSVGALFQLVDPLASCLTPNEADDALNFGLDLLEEALRPEDGDGSWRDDLQPPSSHVEALAGYVWAGLGSPTVAERWKFAHVVRTSVQLEWSDLLAALARRAVEGSALPFVDCGLTFYEWHARQWFLIGLARGALEQPAALHMLVPFLRSAAAEEHVLIRAFAADTLRTLHAAGVVAAECTNGLDTVNQTRFPLDIYTGWSEPVPDEDTTKESSLSDDEKYYFGIDIGPYWFAPLGRAFGVSEVSVERFARQVLRERFGMNSERAWDDARYKRKIFDGNDTSHSHGSMPQTDDLRAYHSYHAMMIVAARLLNKRSVRKRIDDSKDEFQDWIERYLLTRTDGHWLADRRDPRLVAEPPPTKGYADRTWCWSVTAEYLDHQLLTDDGLRVLWGYWSSGDRNDSETVSIRSALVSRDGADALLAALQTAPNTDRFLLPDADRDEVLEAGHLRLFGWVVGESEAARLDEDDPWATKLRYPGPIPCASIVERLALVPSVDERRWTNGSGTLLRSESWTRVVGYGRGQDTVDGTRLSGNLEFVKLLLERHPHDCLVLSVSVRRLPPRDGSGRDEFEPYPWPYIRYYLMNSDGIARPL
jgi:hypothetical protein